MKRQLAGTVTLIVTGGTGEYAIEMHNLNAGIAGIILGIIGIAVLPKQLLLSAAQDEQNPDDAQDDPRDPRVQVVHLDRVLPCPSGDDEGHGAG